MALLDDRMKFLEDLILPLTREPDYEEFWSKVLTLNSEQPIAATSEDVSYVVPKVKVQKVSFAAYDAGRIVGWSITPAEIKPRPTLITFHGYGGHKGKIADYLMWVLQGFTVLAFDVRGQMGESTDSAQYPGGRSRGWLSTGILEPEKYFGLRCAVDILRALDFACMCPEVDNDSLGTMGASQGGGLSLFAAAMDKRTKLCIAEVPGSCNFGYTLERVRSYPWSELIDYFRAHPENVEPTMRTLSYIDLNNISDRIECPTLISVGLDDTICLPETIYAAFNRISSKEKLIKAFSFRGHEDGLITETSIEWARKHLMNT